MPETTDVGPGVRMVPIITHSMEVATLLASLSKKIQQLNVFDAVGAGIGDLKEAAKRINKSLFNVMMNYSPATETYLTLTRTIRGYSTMIETNNLADGALDSLVDALQEHARSSKGEVKFGEGTLTALVINMQEAATRADTVKYGALAQMTSFDQYAYEGGNYKVTPEDQQMAKDKLAEITDPKKPKIDDLTRKAINKLGTKLNPIINARIAAAEAKNVAEIAKKK